MEKTKETLNLEEAPQHKAVFNFIQKVLQKLKLSNEVCLLSIIFIERLVVRDLILRFL